MEMNYKNNSMIIPNHLPIIISIRATTIHSISKWKMLERKMRKNYNNFLSFLDFYLSFVAYARAVGVLSSRLPPLRQLFMLSKSFITRDYKCKLGIIKKNARE